MKNSLHQRKAYIGIKSLSCSSFTTNNAFRNLLAGVFVWHFLRHKNKEGVGRARKREPGKKK